MDHAPSSKVVPEVLKAYLELSTNILKAHMYQFEIRLQSWNKTISEVQGEIQRLSLQNENFQPENERLKSIISQLENKLTATELELELEKLLRPQSSQDSLFRQEPEDFEWDLTLDPRNLTNSESPFAGSTETKVYGNAEAVSPANQPLPRCESPPDGSSKIDISGTATLDSRNVNIDPRPDHPNTDNNKQNLRRKCPLCDRKVVRYDTHLRRHEYPRGPRKRAVKYDPRAADLLQKEGRRKTEPRVGGRRKPATDALLSS